MDSPFSRIEVIKTVRELGQNPDFPHAVPS